MGYRIDVAGPAKDIDANRHRQAVNRIRMSSRGMGFFEAYCEVRRELLDLHEDEKDKLALKRIGMFDEYLAEIEILSKEQS